MAEGGRPRSLSGGLWSMFAGQMGRLMSGKMTREDEKELILHKPRHVLTTIDEERHEVPVPFSNEPKTFKDLLEKGHYEVARQFAEPGRGNREGKKTELKFMPIPVYASPGRGLKAQGFSNAPVYIKSDLGSGAYGFVKLVFRSADMQRPIAERRVAALKVQQVRPEVKGSWDRLWMEVAVLRAVVHPNIMGIHSYFIMDSTKDQPKQRSGARRGQEKSTDKRQLTFPTLRSLRRSFRNKPAKDGSFENLVSESDLEDEDLCFKARPGEMSRKCVQWVILAEFADAGTLMNEIKSQPKGFIPESGARYYVHQIIAGTKYLHSKNLTHNDLHPGNILLAYTGHGREKVCKIGDFGKACGVMPNEQTPFQKDTLDILDIVFQMIEKGSRSWSPEAKKMFSGKDPDRVPATISELLATFAPWFNGPASPPPPLPYEPSAPHKKPHLSRQGTYNPADYDPWAPQQGTDDLSWAQWTDEPSGSREKISHHGMVLPGPPSRAGSPTPGPSGYESPPLSRTPSPFRRASSPRTPPPAPSRSTSGGPAAAQEAAAPRGSWMSRSLSSIGRGIHDRLVDRIGRDPNRRRRLQDDQPEQ